MASWLKTKLFLGFISFVVIFALWSHLAGGIFLMLFGYPFEQATLFTWADYLIIYSGNQAITRWLAVAGFLAAVILVAPALIFLSPARQKLFGTAKFASLFDVRKAGLFQDKGIIVGKKAGKFLMFGGQQHAIISAPTRSGKGVGIVIPNLLNWPESVVVLDIKQENWSLTSGFRAKYGHQCFLFNPAASDMRSHRYNPLWYISDDVNFRIDDVQKISAMLFPDVPGTDVIWTATPRTLFTGVVLYLLETPGKAVTLGQALRESLVDGDGSKHFSHLMQTRSANGKPLSAACVRALNSYCSISSENTRSGVIATYRSRLELWANPLVDAATSGNDFDLREVRRKKLSIYLGVTPDNLERMGPLLNLFFQQLIDLNTRTLPSQDKTLKLSCLLLMDEFTAIGKMGILSKGISYIAGYNLRMLPIIQSPAQLVEVYGKDAAQTFTTNHALNIVYPPKASETQTAKDISEWLGYNTISQHSFSRKVGLGAQNKTRNESDFRRALLLPQEITSLGQSNELVIAENTPPILAKKVVYFRDAVFIKRLKSVSESLNAISGVLTKEDIDNAVLAGELAASVPVLDVEAINALAAIDTPRSFGMQSTTPAATIRPATQGEILNLARHWQQIAVQPIKPPPGKAFHECTPEEIAAIAMQAGQQFSSEPVALNPDFMEIQHEQCKNQ